MSAITIKIIILAVVSIILLIYTIVDKYRGVRKWKRIQSTCTHDECTYFRKCEVCGKIEIVDIDEIINQRLKKNESI